MLQLASMAVSRSNFTVRWAAALLLPLVIPLAALASLVGRGKTVDRTPEQVAKLIEDFVDGTCSSKDWDDLVSLKITDPKLDKLVTDADKSGPPYDAEKLRQIVESVRALKSA